MRKLLPFVLLLGCGGSVETGTTPADGSVSETTIEASVETSIEASTDAPRFDACDGPAQCILAINGCCGKCGAPALSDWDAINKTQGDAHRAAVCTDPAPACPKCATILDPNQIAFCRASRCKAIDVRLDAISECATDSDCRLRAGNGCCEACAVAETSQLIALSKSKGGELEAQVCDPAAGACPPCVPTYPAGVTAICDPTTRHCKVK